MRSFGTRLFSVLAALSLNACGNTQSNTMLQGEQKTSNLDFDKGLIFTVLDNRMIESGDILTLFDAGAIVLADRYELRATGFLTLNSLEANAATLDDGGFHTVSGDVSCQANNCTFRISLRGHACPEISISKRPDYLIPCGNKGYLHLQTRSSLTINTSSRGRAAIDDFEFIVVGSLTDTKDQVIQSIKPDHPLVFAVDQELKQKEYFIDDLLLAFRYWNKMIGFEALQYDPLGVVPNKFDPNISAISLEHCHPCGGDARGQSYSDPISGQIISGKIDIYPELFRASREYQLSTLAHELGHVLGLAHNFAATEDLENVGAMGSTSVMDYGDPTPIVSSLPYDQAAIDWIYTERRPTVHFAHCADREILYKLGCSRSDTAESRKTSSAVIADAYFQILAVDHDAIKKDFMGKDAKLESDLKFVKEMQSRGDLAWALEYLDLLDANLGDIYVAAHKISSFDRSENGAKTRLAWLKALQFTLQDARATYSIPQRDFLIFTEQIFREMPINPGSIESFVHAYNQNAIMAPSQF